MITPIILVDVVPCRVELGRSYLRMGLKQEALRELTTSMTLDVEDINAQLQKEDAEIMLTKLQKEFDRHITWGSFPGVNSGASSAAAAAGGAAAGGAGAAGAAAGAAPLEGGAGAVGSAAGDVLPVVMDEGVTESSSVSVGAASNESDAVGGAAAGDGSWVGRSQQGRAQAEQQQQQQEEEEEQKDGGKERQQQQEWSPWSWGRPADGEQQGRQQ